MKERQLKEILRIKLIILEDYMQVIKILYIVKLIRNYKMFGFLLGLQWGELRIFQSKIEMELCMYFF